MRQALEMALDWIKKQPEETPESKYDVDTRYVVIREIEAALAQPEQEGGVCGRCGGWVSDPVITQPKQEPVASIFISGIGEREFDDWGIGLPMGRNILYTTPPQRKPLTDEEILTVARDHYNPHQRPEISFARAIEAAHNIKE